MKQVTTNPSKTFSAALLLVAFFIGCHRAETKDDITSGDNSQQNDQASHSGEPAKTDSKASAKTQVADRVSTDKPDWRDALNEIEQVSNETEESQQKLERHLENYQRLKKLGDELISTGDAKLAWLELMSFLSRLTASEHGNSQENVPDSGSTLKIDAIESEFSDDTSKWFDELPEATRKHLLADDSKKPTGSARIVRIDFEDLEDADVPEISASVQEVVLRFQAKIASAELPEKVGTVGTLSHVFASRAQSPDGKKIPRVTMLWRP